MDYSERVIDTSIDVLIPIFEKSVLYAAQYCKACGRNCVTGQDIDYAMKYCAMKEVGKDIGSIMPEIYDSSDSEDESDDYLTDDEDVLFTRYQGDDDFMNSINDAFDNWDTWEPCAPIEISLKSAINNYGGGSGMERR